MNSPGFPERKQLVENAAAAIAKAAIEKNLVLIDIFYLFNLVG